ncbi:MAG: ERCC4 domain-containing protein [Bacillota bacterium]
MADVHERQRALVDALESRGVTVEFQPLPVGDFVISRRIGVERKRTDDLLASLMRKRLHRQLAALRTNFERPILIVEGYYLYAGRTLPPDFVRLQIAMLVMGGLTVLVTRDLEDTAGILAALARLEQQGLGYEPSLHARKPAVALEEQARYVVESLPGIGPQLARVLLSHFGSVQRVMAATPDELMQVPGVGKARARRIHSVLTSLAGRPPGDLG